MKRLIIFFTVIIILLLGFYLYYQEGTLPVNKKDTSSKIFIVEPGANLAAIAKKLQNEGLIRNKLVFYIIVKRMGIEKKIQAGDFRLSPSMAAAEIAESLTHGTLDIWVTIIEGLRREEVAQIISRDFDIPEIEFLKQAREGYLFPDTYLIPRNADTTTILNILYANFNKKLSQELKNKAALKKLTLDQVLILASLVEKEARLDSERQEVASIILKRYQNDWPLQIDATLQYAVGYQIDTKTWWKRNLTTQDKEIDSPYNTYKNPGLPPAPICNPGLAAIKAVVSADPTTPYWYYLSDPTGKTHYSKTIEEHNANIQKYLQ